MNGTGKVSEDPLANGLKALPPNTKAGKVRVLMPLIETKIDQGVRISVILEVLKAGGLDMSEGTFKNYLHRFRSRPKSNAGEIDQDIKSAERPPGFEGSEVRAPLAGQQGSLADAPVSMLELDRLMKPDPADQANDLSRYERLGKQQRRSQKS
jgi:hypothetical protein